MAADKNKLEKKNGEEPELFFEVRPDRRKFLVASLWLLWKFSWCIWDNGLRSSDPPMEKDKRLRLGLIDGHKMAQWYSRYRYHYLATQATLL